MSFAALRRMLSAALLVGCSTETPSAHAHRESIRVERELVVGFFPRVADEQVEASEGLQSALAHFGYALSDTSKCLAARGIEVRAVYADEIVFEDEGRWAALDLRVVSNETIGCAFVAPHREAQFVRASVGPSALTLRCPAAASVYFSIPECCPDGFTCCADGTLLAEEVSCSD